MCEYNCQMLDNAGNNALIVTTYILYILHFPSHHWCHFLNGSAGFCQSPQIEVHALRNICFCAVVAYAKAGVDLLYAQTRKEHFH